MFDDENRHTEVTVHRQDSWVDRLAVPKEKGAKGADPLDSSDAQTTHGILKGHYFRELDRQRIARMEMAEDEAFFDHEQWSEEEIAILNERGQVPLVFNVIHNSVNWVTGTERRSPMDYTVLPRREDGNIAAQRKKELLKYLTSVNHSQHHYSRAFADQVKVGLGWLEAGHSVDVSGEPVFDRSESWRNMVWDSTAQDPAYADGRYLFRTKWTDVDVAGAIFPSRKTLLRSCAENLILAGGLHDGSGDHAMDSIEESYSEGATYGTTDGAHTVRPRVRLWEAWFTRMVPNAPVMSGGDFRGELFDPWSRGHHGEIESGRAKVIDRPKEIMHVALFCDRGLLYFGPTPYRHNKYPFTPLWGHRRGRDGMPYGMIRGLKDLQRDVNKRASKALYALSTARVLVEEGSVSDLEKLRDEAARPDAFIPYKHGRQKPEIQTELNLASAHLDMMSRNISMIQQVGGVTDENMGKQSNATSGKAIIARQEQGALSTSIFFDNARFARLHHGAKLLALIEQFYSEEMQFRITDERGKAKWVKINDQSPEPNDITASKADFTIDEEDWRATARQAQAETILDLFAKLAPVAPLIVVNSLDLLVEAMELPKRDEFVKRIRQITGVADPDADPNNPDPETIALMQAKAEEQALQKRGIEAEIAGKEADATLKMAQAKKTDVEIGNARLEAQQKVIDQLNAAMEAAVNAVGAQEVAAVADKIIAQAINRANAQMMPPPAPAGQALPPPAPEMMLEGAPA